MPLVAFSKAEYSCRAFAIYHSVPQPCVFRMPVKYLYKRVCHLLLLLFVLLPGLIGLCFFLWWLGFLWAPIESSLRLKNFALYDHLCRVCRVLSFAVPQSIRFRLSTHRLQRAASAPHLWNPFHAPFLPSVCRAFLNNSQSLSARFCHSSSSAPFSAFLHMRKAAREKVLP